jgi:hypothetical protein
VLQELLFARLDLVVTQGVDDLTLHEEVVAVGDGCGEAEVLLNEQDGDAVLLGLGEERCHLLNEERGEALGRLVEEEQARAHAEDAGDGEHLLLAAGELRAALAAAVFEAWEHGVDTVEAPRLRADGRGEEEVLFDGEASVDATVVRNVAEATAGALVGREAGDVGTLEENLAASLLVEAHEGAQGGGLAGAVAADEGDDLALVDVEREVVQGLRLTVPGGESLDAEHASLSPRARTSSGGVNLCPAVQREIHRNYAQRSNVT